MARGGINKGEVKKARDSANNSISGSPQYFYAKYVTMSRKFSGLILRI